MVVELIERVFEVREMGGQRLNLNMLESRLDNNE